MVGKLGLSLALPTFPPFATLSPSFLFAFAGILLLWTRGGS
jgi:hypothetical protein